MPSSNKPKVPQQLTPGGLIATSILSAPFGYLAGGISGSIGRWGVSFFNPAIASVAGTFGTFGGMGALSAPLMIIPGLLLNHAFNKSKFLNENPNLKAFLTETAGLLLNVATTSAAAAILGFPPFGATTICMMALPVTLYALKQLCNAVNACLASGNDLDPSSLGEGINTGHAL